MFGWIKDVFNSTVGQFWAATKIIAAPVTKTWAYFVDDTFRDKVRPVPGSVVYCDLKAWVEHSGIYVRDGQIANIAVTGTAESVVRLSDGADFSDSAWLQRGIYVSCDSSGRPVGHPAIAHVAQRHIGQRGFYGYIYQNCHTFSTKCVQYAPTQSKDWDDTLIDGVLAALPDTTWEPNMQYLKTVTAQKIGGVKWLLWDWENDHTDENEEDNPRPKIERPKPQPPNFEEIFDLFQNMPLDAENVPRMREEKEAIDAYLQQITGENIPADILEKLRKFQFVLMEVLDTYEKARPLLAQLPGGGGLSFNDLKNIQNDIGPLSTQLQGNRAIADLVKKLGRAYISEEKKRSTRLPTPTRDEVHGTHRSADLMRLLPQELLNLQDPDLENLFYARLFEHGLQTYELQGTGYKQGEEIERQKYRTGPVVACLDTSGSMGDGRRLLKARALLLAVATILKQENRSLHVLLFGDAGQISEYAMEAPEQMPGLLKFLQSGFGGGTNFEYPLKRAVEIIRNEERYMKADILMITDGACGLGDDFAAWLRQQKTELDASVYTVLCDGARIQDKFSDEVLVI